MTRYQDRKILFVTYKDLDEGQGFTKEIVYNEKLPRETVQCLAEDMFADMLKMSAEENKSSHLFHYLAQGRVQKINVVVNPGDMVYDQYIREWLAPVEKIFSEVMGMTWELRDVPEPQAGNNNG